jgi:hypothetical protein
VAARLALLIAPPLSMERMLAEIDTSIPLALHPDVLQTVGEDWQTDPVVGAARSALDTAHKTFAATVHGHRTILADVTHTPEANLQRSSKVAATRQTETLQRLDGAIERCNREIQAIDTAIATPPNPVPPHLIGVVASALRSMTPEQRSAAVTEAIQSGDAATIHLLFQGPAFASGMTAQERSLHKTTYLHTSFPHAIARRAALEHTVERLMAAGQSLHSAHAALFDRKRLEDAAEKARAAQAVLGD